MYATIHSFSFLPPSLFFLPFFFLTKKGSPAVAQSSISSAHSATGTTGVCHHPQLSFQSIDFVAVALAFGVLRQRLVYVAHADLELAV